MAEPHPRLWSRLRYQWHDLPCQRAPTPVRAEVLSLTLWCDGHKVFSGDLTEEVAAWARWCARAVTELWDCPKLVQTYLETGDETLRRAAHEALMDAMAQIPYGEPDSAERAAYCTCWAANYTFWRTNSLTATGCAAQEAARWATEHLEGEVQTAARQRQAAHLLHLILRRILKPRFHPLLEAPEHGPVLYDAFLEAAHG